MLSGSKNFQGKRKTIGERVPPPGAKPLPVQKSENRDKKVRNKNHNRTYVHLTQITQMPSMYQILLKDPPQGGLSQIMGPKEARELGATKKREIRISDERRTF